MTFLGFTTAQLSEKFEFEVLDFIGALTVVAIELYVYNLTGKEHVLGESHFTACLRTAKEHETSYFAQNLKPVILGLYL